MLILKEEIIKDILKDLTEATPGIEKTELNKIHYPQDELSKVIIEVNLVFKKDIHDIISISLDFKNALFLNLSSKLGYLNLQIDIFII